MSAEGAGAEVTEQGDGDAPFGERWYHRLPPWVQDLAITVEGARIVRRRYGKPFAERLRAYEDRASWSRHDFEQYRDARLRSMAAYAAMNVPHYSTGAYRGLDEIEGLDDLSHFPVLSRDEVRSLGDRLHPTEPIPGRAVALTSGTMGSPLEVPICPSAVQEQWAVWWRYRRWHGIERGTWCGHFGSRRLTRGDQRVWRVDRAQRRVMFSAFHTNPAQLDEMVDVLVRRRLPWLHGFPSVISLVAARVIDRGLTGRLGVRWVTTGAENIQAHQRELILQAFEVDPIEHYGAAEKVANASQCPLGALHVDEDFGALEVVDGEVVGTALANPAFPLIRYRMGDGAAIGETECRCGRPGRILEGLDGRLDDYVVLADGGRLGRLDLPFKGLGGVRMAQFVQRSPGSAELLVVPEPGFGESDRERLRQRVLSYADGGLDLTITEVPEVTRTKGGKVRLVVSELV